MTRTEFDMKVREMKTQRHNAIGAIAKMQAEIKEEIAAKWRQVNDIQKEISKLGQSLQGYNQRRLTLEQMYRTQINAFIRENEPSTTSNLAEATTLNIVYELRNRGFSGIIQNDTIGQLYDLDKEWEREETTDSSD